MILSICKNRMVFDKTVKYPRVDDVVVVDVACFDVEKSVYIQLTLFPIHNVSLTYNLRYRVLSFFLAIGNLLHTHKKSNDSMVQNENKNFESYAK